MNTHVHSDHTGANAFFAQQGAVIFAQDNLRMEMMRPPARAGGGAAAAAGSTGPARSAPTTTTPRRPASRR